MRYIIPVEDKETFDKTKGWTMSLLALGFMFCVCLWLTGCGVVNGIGADTENIGRFLRTHSQKSVDKMELRRISDGIKTQNRIMSRGQELTYHVK